MSGRGALLNSRLELLIATLLPAGGYVRGLFEQLYEQRMAEWLEQVKQERKRSKLTEGI